MWAAVLLLGCPKRAPDSALALAAAIAEADRSWDDRAEGGLAPVGAALRDAWMLHRDDAALGWRVIRWRLAEGDAARDEADARASWAVARAEMVVCLDGDGLFAQRRRESGWDAALRRLAPERSACAAWGALAWVRWVEALGPDAAALDLPAIDALLAAGARGPGGRDPAGWASGVLTAIRTDAGRDAAHAQALLREAVARDPGSLQRRIDLWHATGDLALEVALRNDHPRRPEDAGAWTRAFGGGAPEGDAPGSTGPGVSEPGGRQP